MDADPIRFLRVKNIDIDKTESQQYFYSDRQENKYSKSDPVITKPKMKRTKKFSKRVFLLLFFLKAILVSAYPSSVDQTIRGKSKMYRIRDLKEKYSMTPDLLVTDICNYSNFKGNHPIFFL